MMKWLRASVLKSTGSHARGSSPGCTRSRSFLYPSAEVKTRAVKLGAIPYDVDGVELNARRPAVQLRCDVEKSALGDPALHELAIIVRGADTDRLDLARQYVRPSSISLGLSHNFGNGHKMLRHGFVMYDALYAWLCHVRGETHTCSLLISLHCL